MIRPVEKPTESFGPDYIAAVLMWAKTQFHLFHIQTTSYEIHQALGTFYEEVTELADDIIECLLGRLNLRLSKLALPSMVPLASREPLDAMDKMTIFADQLFHYGNDLNYQDIANLAAELQQLINKTRYRLSLK